MLWCWYSFMIACQISPAYSSWDPASLLYRVEGNAMIDVSEVSCVLDEEWKYC